MYKYLPTYVYLSIYDIDFTKLYAEGIRNIIADLDNTLLPYSVMLPTQELIAWKNDLKKRGIKLYIISNNKAERIKKVVDKLEVDGFLAKSHKPSKKRVLKYLNSLNIKLDQTILLGDQLVTDIACANNLEIKSILVKTIDLKCQKWYTKINRLREKSIIKKIININPEIGYKIKSLYENKEAN